MLGNWQSQRIVPFTNLFGFPCSSKGAPDRQLVSRGRCSFTRCNGRRHHVEPGNSRGYSRWCLIHTCPHINSPLAINCRGQKRASQPFCSKHNECAFQGCEVSIHRSQWAHPHRQPTWFCPQHEHLQPKQMAGVAGFICQAPKCSDPRPHNVPYCERHICSSPKCDAIRHEEEAHCVEHLPCKQETCENFRVKKRGKLSKFCHAHHECGDQLGDENHKCKTVLPAESSFCNEHRCVADKCEINKETWLHPDNRYCKYHTCQRAKCTEQTENTDKNRDHKFCSRHTCQRKKCMAEVRGDDAYFPFCRDHDVRIYATPATSIGSAGSSIADEDSDSSARRRYERRRRRGHAQHMYVDPPAGFYFANAV